MELFSSILLGLVQGITEFLPISSSGHLIIVRDMLHIQTSYGLAFDAVIQLATTIAVLMYFRHDIAGLIRSVYRLVLCKSQDVRDKRFAVAIILGTIPVVLFGLLLEDYMETTFRTSAVVAITLIIGSIVMWFAEKYARHEKTISVGRGFVIGLFQTLALLPGMSRSGMTIAGGLYMGLSREEATRFSFLLAFPILCGTGLKKLLDLWESGLLSSIGVDVAIASVVAFVTGLGAIHFLMTYVRRHTLHIFIWYRVLLAIVLLIAL